MSFEPITTPPELALLDRLHSPIWIFDIAQMRMWWANLAAVELWQAESLTALLNRDWSDYSDATHIRLQSYLEKFAQGETITEQWTFYPKQGTPVSVHCVFSGIPIETGRLAMLVEGQIDHLEQTDPDILCAIEALRHTSVMISLYTLDGQPLLQNPAAIRCYGDGRQGGSHAHTFARRFVDTTMAEKAITCIQSGQVFSVDTIVHTLQGLQWHGLDARCTRDPQSGRQAILVNERNISDRKHAELALRQTNERLELSNQELQRATRLKDEFLSTMSHELRTPLNAILGMSELLQHGFLGLLNDQQANAVKTIDESGHHLLDLINDILEVSTLEAGKLELDLTSVSVSQLCYSSVTVVKPHAVQKQIHLQVQLPENLQPLIVDERRMRQVLISLLSNAIKFTPQDGQVILTVHRAIPNLGYPVTGDYLCFSVTDNGIGIAAADQARLFQPFIQLDSGLSRQYEGTGLGLTLVKQIVELHNGFVSLQSTLGQGSCFTIGVPVAKTVGIQ